MQAAGIWEGTAETYLEADGPVPVGIEGIEEEVCVGGGVWGGKGTGWGVLGTPGSQAPTSAVPLGVHLCPELGSPLAMG